MKNILLSIVAACMLLAGPARAVEGGNPKPTHEYVEIGDITLTLMVSSTRPHYLIISPVLDVDEASAEVVRNMLPRLRNDMLICLMALQDNNLLSQGSLVDQNTIVKDSLTEVVDKLKIDGVRSVLITRFVRN